MAHHPTTNPHTHGGGDDGHHGVGHVVPPKVLLATGGALLVLTVVTVAAAKIDFAALDLTELNIIVALAIAVVKASLVCLFFMHLRWDRPFNAFVLVGSIAFVALFIGFAMMDTNEYQEELLPGESTVIQQKLDALPKVDVTAAAGSEHAAGH